MKDENLTIIRISNSSWFKIRFHGLIIHFDPGFVGDFSSPNIAISELREPADYIFVSHCHFDHFRDDVVNDIIKDSTMIVAPICLSEITKLTYQSVKPGDQISIQNICLRAVDAYNTEEGRSSKKFHVKGQFVGYLLKLGKTVLYFAGDTDYIPEMHDFGPIDIALLPIGGTYVMDSLEAIEAIKALKPKYVIGMHQSQNNLDGFKELCKENTSSTPIVLKVGDQF